MELPSLGLLQIHFSNSGSAAFAGMAGFWVIVRIAVSVLAAICLYVESSRLNRNAGPGPRMFPSILWAGIALLCDMTSLVGLVFLFYALHHTNWFERLDRGGSSTAAAASTASMHEAHHERMAALEAELAELRERNRGE